jgi:hypothetical protein
MHACSPPSAIGCSPQCFRSPWGIYVVDLEWCLLSGPPAFGKGYIGANKHAQPSLPFCRSSGRSSTLHPWAQSACHPWAGKSRDRATLLMRHSKCVTAYLRRDIINKEWTRSSGLCYATLPEVMRSDTIGMLFCVRIV